MINKIKVKILVSHPIPYFVPLWRELSKSNSIDLLVCFYSKAGITKRFSSYFNVEHKWDINLLDGYKHTFISNAPDGKIKSQPLGDAKKYLTQI